ncbi:S-adenosyl-L-methionine-dependent methyltransferase [Halteromyces radiatus]|uniref:S-adenosyl-L-methionine-dependent methyltransferase n=1 Tax=Halteromyces radiatus TaxID=101107 RepID=UPI00221FBF2B|nr:S-adenosyl-L-methionine-dependent methyltransferase [Halteromyces radiatus]KAI8092652.1 S-adenosyl-L-methionine-dependent methyltransferase [Halteromyces radiatus]
MKDVTLQNDQWSADNYNTHASFVPQLGNTILSMLNAQSHERILDVGCGSGELTNDLASQCAQVVGIDASPDMINKANRIRRYDNTTYHVVDGQAIPSWLTENQIPTFDAVFSNAALHWMKNDPEGVIKGMHKALKSGGRIAVEFGGFMNVGEVHTALIQALNRRGLDGKAYSPWFFPSDIHYRHLLEKHGFNVQQIDLIPRPTRLDTDVAGWIETFGFTFLNALPTDRDRQQMIQEIVEQLRPSYQREDGAWYVMYVRLRAVAIKT